MHYYPKLPDIDTCGSFPTPPGQQPLAICTTNERTAAAQAVEKSGDQVGKRTLESVGRVHGSCGTCNTP